MYSKAQNQRKENEGFSFGSENIIIVQIDSLDEISNVYLNEKLIFDEN